MNPMSIDRLLDTLATRRTVLARDLSAWWIAHEAPAFAGSRPPLKWKRAVLPARWGGYDRTTWFKTSFSVPAVMAGHPLCVRVDLPEGLAFLNGRPHQGVDAHHRDIILTTRSRAGQRFRLEIQAYSGRTHKRRVFTGARLVVPDRAVRELHAGLKQLKALSELKAGTAADRRRLDDLLRSLSTAGGSGASPRTLLTLARAGLNRRPPRRPVVDLIGHSHIDVVWLWTLKETRRKCARTFGTALRLLETFPEFRFAQSQALLYDIVRREYPDLFRQIRRRVREGRWEPVGCMWVEPDCNIVNGESIVRQILYGKAFFRKHLQTDSGVLWLPDTFGYSAALPQILRKSGIRNFFTTKLLWNDTTRFPLTTFLWEGIDGSKVLAHNPPVGLEGLASAGHLRKGASGNLDAAACPATLQTFGYGDGGGGATESQILGLRLLRNAPGLPSSSVSTVERFYRRALRSSGGLKTLSGELYLEMHRGTYTTHGWIKRENRRAEDLLYATELLCTLAALRTGRAGEYPAAEIEASWKRLLLNQFHDIVPGTAIAAATEDARRDFARIHDECGRIQRGAVRSLAAGVRRAGVWSVFNPLATTRSEYVRLPVPSTWGPVEVRDADGSLVPSQSTSDPSGTLLCFLPDLPGFSFRTISARRGGSGPPADVVCRAGSRFIETPTVRVSFDRSGRIVSLIDRTTGKECITPRSAANEFQTFADEPKQWQAWEIDPLYEQRRVHLLTFEGSEVRYQGALSACLRLYFRTRNGSRIVQDVAAYHSTPRVDFRTAVDWREKNVLLKAAFPFNVRTDRAAFEIQFGALARTTRPRTPEEQAKFEIPGQQWADLSGRDFGVSLLNDSKYGYDVSGSTLRLSLIRSPRYPHDIEPMTKAGRGWTDQGTHTFAYAILPHPAGWEDAQIPLRAREFNVAPLLLPGVVPNAPHRYLDLRAKTVLVDSVKRAEDGRGFIVRAHESTGRRDVADLRIGLPVRVVEECSLMEEKVRRLKSKRGVVRMAFRPYEIKTLRLVP